MPQVVPLVLKVPVSIVVIGDTGLEPHSLRAVLESFNYRVEIHWVGSRAEALEIFRGAIPTFDHLIVSCHGDPEVPGGAILVPDEDPISAADLTGRVHLPGKTVLNLGCGLGTLELARAFLGGGCAAYIGASDYVEGNSAVFFAIHLYYFLTTPNRLPLGEAITRARSFDAECGLFNGFVPPVETA
ncbi:MAG: hypothetical protein JNM70_01090 [Anaerolineae bacterium]|nr:hypothetical protein [Anaerolineae bacterium]